MLVVLGSVFLLPGLLTLAWIEASARTTKRFPSSRCASAVKIVRPLESIVETQPKLQPALLRLSADDCVISPNRAAAKYTPRDALKSLAGEIERKAPY